MLGKGGHAPGRLKTALAGPGVKKVPAGPTSYHCTLPHEGTNVWENMVSRTNASSTANEQFYEIKV